MIVGGACARAMAHQVIKEICSSLYRLLFYLQTDEAEDWHFISNPTRSGFPSISIDRFECVQRIPTPVLTCTDKVISGDPIPLGPSS